jgi:hypothetical protein
MVKVKVPYGASGEDGSRGDSVDARDNVANGVASPGSSGAATIEGAEAPDWMALARDAYEDSDRFHETSLKQTWERNERAFRSQHPSGSKYFSSTYKRRSRLYRPKTRAMIRTAEAQLAQSYFSNEDVVSVKAVDANSANGRISADVWREVLQYRLSAKSSRIKIPWFRLAVGAYQDAQKYGVVCSKQWWEFKEREEITLVPQTDEASGQPMLDESGTPMLMEQTSHRTVIDRPRVTLIPPENLRIDRAADWMDPINSSPFVIIMTPMYIQDVKARMRDIDRKTGRPTWYPLSDGELKSSTDRQIWDSTRQYREGRREDSQDSQIAIPEFSIVWVHENFMRQDDEDWVYYTAGIHHMLSEPKPVREVYLHCQDGERPIVMGSVLIETHRAYPTGKPELTQDLQREANDIQNLRLDNIKLALNKRYLVKRGKQVDLQSLLRNSAGSVTLVTDTEEDVKVLETKDVTASSYQEQDRINVDFDDIAGNFSAGTVQTNRRMNETVGGMQLLSGAANLISELDLRVFTETWAEEVLTQVLQMEQRYETDLTILALAGERAQIIQKYGVNHLTDEILSHELAVTVNVGLGATDPMQRLGKFQMAAKILGDIFGPALVQMMNKDEVIAEVFGPLGYRDGKRFIKLDGPDPAVIMLQEELEELTKKLETRQLDSETKREVARLGGVARLLQQLVENKGRLDLEGARTSGSLRTEQMRGDNAAHVEALRQILAPRNEGGNSNAR